MAVPIWQTVGVKVLKTFKTFVSVDTCVLSRDTFCVFALSQVLTLYVLSCLVSCLALSIRFTST